MICQCQYRCRRAPLWLLLLATCLPAASAADAGPQPAIAADSKTTVLTGRTMGTTYRIKYWGDGARSPQQMQQAVDGLLADFDRQMSTYRADSELSQFNRAGAGEWFDVSRHTAFVVSKAIEYHKLTDGASDVTIAPVLRLWHFGPARPGAPATSKLAPPSAADLQAAGKLVGAQRLSVRDEPPALRKDLDGVEVDLNSIAPGYAVDLLVEALADAGFSNAVVEVGGEVRGAGTHPDGAPWRVGVEAPARGPASLSRVVPLRDLALSTSGDYRNFRTAGGQRFTHIIDPRTFQPLPYRGVAVTVLASTCIEADALGTALMVMGPQIGQEWCAEHEVAALFQFPSDGKEGRQPVVSSQATQRFEELVPEAVAQPNGAPRLEPRNP